MSLPISKNMLVCSASLFTEQSEDEDRNVAWNNEISLNRIWITGSMNQSQGAQGEQPSDAFILYYDMKNSSATQQQTVDGETVTVEVTPQFDKGQKVVWGGKDYYINTITPCYAFGGIHHYELGLN